MKKFFLVLLAVVVVALGAIIFFSVKTGKELRPLADAILRDLAEGRVEKVHREASPRFREGMDVGAFEQYVAGRRGALGAYRGIVKTTGAGVATSTDEGTTGNVKLDLDYEKGKTDAELHFEKVDGRWALLRIRITVPEALVPKADPAQLEGLGRELLDLFARGQMVALYDRFAPELKAAWPAERFQAEMAAFREKMGAPGAPVFEGHEDAEGGYVVARFTVPFEAARATARIKCFWRGGTWDVLGFAVGER